MSVSGPFITRPIATSLLAFATVLGGWLIHRVMLVEDERTLKPIPIRIDENRRRPRR